MIDDPTLPRTWRPQSFGKRAARHIDDPLVEPLWSGIRVLAHCAAHGVGFLDTHGESQSWPEVEAAVAASVQADSAVLDGYLTTEAASDGTGVVTGIGVPMPNAGQMTRQLIMGGERSRRGELQEALEAAAPPTFEVGDVVVFVAVDLLLLDDEPLLEVPLLERKRLLDAVLQEGVLVRRGMHVRPPIDVWISTWRSLGFRQMAYKQANSRYVPGEPNEDWATAQIPRQ